MIVLIVGLLLVVLYLLRRLARAGETLDALSRQLDEAYQATAALSVDRGSAAVWHRRARLAVMASATADDRRIATACASVAAHGARELERHLAAVRPIVEASIALRNLEHDPPNADFRGATLAEVEQHLVAQTKRAGNQLAARDRWRAAVDRCRGHCANLTGFADGELEPELAEAFRAHLRGCERCQRALLEAMQLEARLSELQPDGRR